MKRWLPLIVFIAILLVAPRALAQSATPPAPTPPTSVSPSPSADELNERLSRLMDMASKTTDQASMVLGFIQALSIFGGLLAAIVGTVLGAGAFNRLRQYDRELKNVQEQLAKEQTEAASLRKNLEADTREQVRKLLDQTNQGIADTQRKAADTTRALTLLQLGEGQFETGNISAAVRAYDEAVRLDPENPAANYQLGELYLILKDRPKAVMHLENVLKTDPDFPPAVAALGYALRLEGDSETDRGRKNNMYADAEKLLIRALSLDPNVRDANRQSVNGTLAGLYRREGRIVDAIHYYQLAETITPEDSYPIGNLAVLFLMQGNVEESRRYYQRGLILAQQSAAQRPGDFWKRFDIATAQIALDSPEWERDLRTALRIAPTQLDKLLGGLKQLRDTPNPPKSAEAAIQMVEAEIARLQAMPAGP